MTAGGALRVALAASFLAIQGAHATQVTSSRPDPIAYATPIQEGFASTDAGGRSADAFLIRPMVWLRGLEDHSWGIRLRLGMLVGTAFSGASDPDAPAISLAALIPGVEAVVPLGSRTLLRPFIDVGGGWLDEDRSAFLLGAGLASEHVFSGGPFELGLQPIIDFRGAFGEGGRNDALGNFAVAGDARLPLWFTIDGNRLETGIYAKQTFLWSGLDLAATDGSTVTADRFLELGILFGFENRPKILLFRLPTLGVGYRFGEITGITIRIGGDRIIRLP